MTAPSIVYVRWGSRRNRADDIARALGARLLSLPKRPLGAVLTPLRYLLQFVLTLILLVRSGSRVVISQHTQPFGSLACLIYAKLSGAAMITDCHNAPFTKWPWSRAPLSWVNRLIFRRASLNLVHNEGIRHYAVEDLKMPGRFAVLHDLVPDILDGPKAELLRPAVVMACSFAPDEPVAAMIDAAARLPEVNFSITGDANKLPTHLRRSVPGNCTLTGFLPDAEYDSLVRSADVVVALSNYRDVLMRACQEAIGASRPLVVSEGRVARDYLTGGTTFVSNDTDSIVAGVREALDRSETLQAEMMNLREAKLRLWPKRLTAAFAEAGVVLEADRAAP